MSKAQAAPHGRARFWQILFVISLVALSWYLMQAVHEFGHVAAALFSGGTVQRVVLSPLEISRTDVEPNPWPGLVVWAGPLVGCLLPLVVWLCAGRVPELVSKSLQFFAGWCLIANGGYIGLGTVERIGDCGEMLRTGTPPGVMVGFGLATVAAGLYLWHRLGSLKEFWNHPEWITPRTAITINLMLGGVVVLLAFISLIDV
ncbi:MAG: M50 family metallopeptidase [Pirellulaceae bacterium]